MEKYFVTHSQAVALKELGFDMPCFGWYHPNGYIIYAITKDKDSIVNTPLKSQVFEWARKKHKIHCSYGTTSDSREEVNGYCISNFINGNRNYLHIDWEVGSYEEAESACIDKLIEICHDK